jgi:hypothetical protein
MINLGGNGGDRSGSSLVESGEMQKCPDMTIDDYCDCKIVVIYIKIY